MPEIMTRDEFAEDIRRKLHEIAAAIPVQILIGITGSRESPTNGQQSTLAILVYTLARMVDGQSGMHHGCCIGTDAYAHVIARTIPGMEIHGHPGYGANKRSPYRMQIDREQFTTIAPALPYAQRNRIIVEKSSILLSCPRYPETDKRSAHSGTWQTIRIARRLHKPVIIIPPAGVAIRNHRHLYR